MFKATSYHLIDQLLASDIYSESGVLLLPKGYRLKAADITMLLNREIYEVQINHSTEASPSTISETVSEQFSDLWINPNNSLKEKYLSSLENIKSLFKQSIHEQIPSLQEFMEVYAPLFEETIQQSFLFHPLHKIRGHDEYTYRHSINVGLLSGVIGKVLGLKYNEIYLLGQMGLLHDLGKLKIQEQILNKPGKLTQDEYNIIKRHTIYGYELLQEMKGTNESINRGALSHHERLDGSGYPYKVKGDEIPFLIQILSVADTYDAICSDRIYQQKASPYYAVQELMMGVHLGKFSPTIVIPFVNYLTEGYVGDQAVLDNGDIGEVIYIHPEEPHRPLIRIGSDYLDLRKHRNINILDVIPY